MFKRLVLAYSLDERYEEKPVLFYGYTLVVLPSAYR
jgi:hypothetical protein